MDELYCQNCNVEVNEKDSHCKCCGHELPNPSKGSYHNVEQWISHKGSNKLEKNDDVIYDFPPIKTNSSQGAKPDNMSEEQWADYQHMSANPGKGYSTMTGRGYMPSKEEIAFQKKWKSEADKAREHAKFGDEVVKWILISVFILFIFILSL